MLLVVRVEGAARWGRRGVGLEALVLMRVVLDVVVVVVRGHLGLWLGYRRVLCRWEVAGHGDECWEGCLTSRSLFATKIN